MRRAILLLLLLASVAFADGQLIYVDGDGTPDGDGAGTTASPLLGPTGLQHALDAAAGGSYGVTNTDSNDIIIYLRDDVTISGTLMIDANAASGDNAWKRLIGCSGTGSTWTRLTGDNWVTIDAGADPGCNGSAIIQVEIGNVGIEQIYAKDPGGTATLPTAGEHGFDFQPDAATYGYYLRNVKSTYAYHGIETVANARSLSVYNPVVTDYALYGVHLYSPGSLVHGGVIVGTQDNTDQRGIYLHAAGTVSHCTIAEGGYGVMCSHAYSSTIANNAIFNSALGCIAIVSSTVDAMIENNILDVNDPTTDKAIHWTDGRYAEFANITDCDTFALSGFQVDSGSTYNLTFTDSDPLVDPKNGDYRYGSQSIATTYVRDQGLQPYGDGTNYGRTSVGAYQKTQIQEAGGSAGPTRKHPIPGGSIAR